MDKHEAAIVSAYTGYLIGEFSDMHEYIEKVMKRPVFTHEMASEKIVDEIKQAATDDFMDIEVS
jgi:hypothetical protein